MDVIFPVPNTFGAEFFKGRATKGLCSRKMVLNQPNTQPIRPD